MVVPAGRADPLAQQRRVGAVGQQRRRAGQHGRTISRACGAVRPAATAPSSRPSATSASRPGPLPARAVAAAKSDSGSGTHRRRAARSSAQQPPPRAPVVEARGWRAPPCPRRGAPPGSASSAPARRRAAPPPGGRGPSPRSTDSSVATRAHAPAHRRERPGRVLRLDGQADQVGARRLVDVPPAARRRRRPPPRRAAATASATSSALGQRPDARARGRPRSARPMAPGPDEPDAGRARRSASTALSTG